MRMPRCRRRNALIRPATRCPATVKTSRGNAAPAAKDNVKMTVGEPEMACGPGDDDCGEHRSGTGHIEHPEGQPQTETALSSTNGPLRQPRERTLEQFFDPREYQSQSDECQHRQAHPSHGVLRQVQ